MTMCILKFLKKFHQQFIVCKNLMWPVILGLDFSHNYLIGITWFSSNQLQLHQGLKSIVRLDPAPSPLHVNWISTLPLPHLLVMMVSQVTIPPRTIAVIPTTFSGIPKPNHHYIMIESSVQDKLQQHFLVVPVLKMFGEKSPLWLLCIIVHTNPDAIVLPKHRHLGEMKLPSTSDNPVEPLMVKEVMYAIKSDQGNTHSDSFLPPKCIHQWLKTCTKNLDFNAQCHSNTQTGTPNWCKDPEGDKSKLYEMLLKYKAIKI